MTDSVGDDMSLSAHEVDAAPDTAAPTTTGNEHVIDIETGEILAVPDRGDFSDFYRAERAGLVRAVSLALHDDEFGTDAVDEAFVRACQHWGSLQTMANPAGWVYRVAMNWATSVLRTRRRHRAKQGLVARSDAVTDRPPDLDLQLALTELSDSHRSVVVCRYYLDWSVEETADALGVPTGTVKSRLARALAQLEAILGSPTTTPTGAPS